MCVPARSVLLVGTLILFLVGCTSDVPSDKDVLISLTDEVIVPAYQDVAQDMASLHQDIETLCDKPSIVSQEAAQLSWRSARASWMRSGTMRFGPAMDRRSESFLDWHPTDVNGIDQLLSEARPVSASEVREVLPSTQRGLSAIEYVLFVGDALVSQSHADGYCAYLTALSEVALAEAEAILSEWMEGTNHRPAYRDYFTERSSTALLASSALSEVVRSQVFLIREIVDMRLASALGLRDENVDLSAIPGTVADNGLEDLRNEILGMQATYHGRGEEGLGISHLVAPLSEETDQRMRSQFTSSIAAIDIVDGPLREALVQRPHQVQDMYDSLSELQRTIATEVVSLLGVSIGFTDTDGDSLR